MMMRSITPTIARRLVVSRQRLAGVYPQAGTAAMLDVIRDLGCLQLDPISAVSRSHTLVLRSRLGAYDRADLDRLLWQERSLFEFWAHAASIVLTEDYPVHAFQMNVWRESASAWGERVRLWVEQNAGLRQHILEEISAKGALPSSYFEDSSVDSWYSSGWTSNRNVSQMLGHLWDTGVIMVANRKNNHRYWDLAERCLPEWTPREPLPPHELTARAAQKSLRALGVGTAKHIQAHYTRSRYPELGAVLKTLEADGLIERIKIQDGGTEWSDTWYIHRADLPLLERLEAGDWQPRTTLLSPFDNLICDRNRTERLFDFNFRIEIYVPKVKRQYGYYVLPILHGDRLIGRIDPLVDRKQNTLTVNAVYAEPDAPDDRETARAVADSIQELAAFVGAKAIHYGSEKPAIWKQALQ